MLLNKELLLSRIRLAPHDSFIKQVRKQMEAGEETVWSWEDGLLRRGGRIYVPNHERLRVEVMAQFHDHKLRGHPGEKRTQSLINQLFFWKGHSKDIRNYVRSCQTCQ